MTPEQKTRMARQFMEAIPYVRCLKMSLTMIEDGVAEMSMPFDDMLVGDPQTGVIHGGAVSALMDTCCGAAVVSHPSVPGSTATLDLRIDYMRAAKPGQGLVARAQCYQVTRSVAFVRATTYDQDKDHPVATATGAFTVSRGDFEVKP